MQCGSGKLQACTSLRHCVGSNIKAGASLVNAPDCHNALGCSRGRWRERAAWLPSQAGAHRLRAPHYPQEMRCNQRQEGAGCMGCEAMAGTSMLPAPHCCHAWAAMQSASRLRAYVAAVDELRPAAGGGRLRGGTQWQHALDSARLWQKQQASCTDHPPRCSCRSALLLLATRNRHSRRSATALIPTVKRWC